MFIRNAAVSAKHAFSVIARQSGLYGAHRTDCGVVHDKQDVRVPRHSVQHRGKLRQLHLERVKLLAHARARMLQRFDQLARALVPSRAEVVRLLGAVRRGGGGDDEEGRALEQDGLRGAAGLRERRQMF